MYNQEIEIEKIVDLLVKISLFVIQELSNPGMSNNNFYY